MGGSPALADACVATRLGEHFGNDAFWLSVIRWFIAHPGFDLVQVGPVVDFIRHVKFESTWTRDGGGSRFTPAPQPGFSMAGRTPESLLRQMEQWHARLHRGGAVPAPVAKGWAVPGFHGLRLEKLRRRGPGTKWTIELLDSTAALEREGRQMHHCVAWYARRCAAGVCSIWSLKALVGKSVLERHTVEISRDRVIVQCRGKLNALPSAEVVEILRRWAAKENLTLAGWF